jgi:hypothetical protein
MRRIHFVIAVSVALTGSPASIANSQTGAPSQSPIPAATTKDCKARILKESPKAEFVGPFARLSPVLGRMFHEGFLYIAAPTRAPGFMGRIVKHSMGCRYYIRDGKLVFDDLIPEIHLPRRALLPGEK